MALFGLFNRDKSIVILRLANNIFERGRLRKYLEKGYKVESTTAIGKKRRYTEYVLRKEVGETTPNIQDESKEIK